jgi:hypothetical protein
MHVVKNTGELKPNFFSHVETKGCSIQRDNIATQEELRTFVEGFYALKDQTVLLGVVSTSCEQVRAILSSNSLRAVCVYDTALPKNPAHAELFETRHCIEEADRVEMRRLLLAAFGDGKITKRDSYRGGALWNSLAPHLQRRPDPPCLALI